jgi:integrase
MTDSFSVQSAVQTQTDTQAPKKNGRGRKMESDPFQVGKGKDASWSMRRRVAGQDFFLSGFSSRSAVKQAMKELVEEARKGNRHVGRGAHMTCVAQALQDYALERLPFLKGAPQEARRVNVYLRAAGLALLKVVPLARSNDFVPTPGKSGKGAYFRIELEPHTHERRIPNGLHAYRRALASANASSDRLRAVLAGTSVADVSRHQLQQLMDRMTQDGTSAATVGLERALLRRMFNHAFSSWSWSQLLDNPATKLRMPVVDNERDRVLSYQEQALLDEALTSCRNELVAPTLALLRETAMRASEPLEHATWADVDWANCIIRLGDAKAGKRDVPLSPAAIEALGQLKARGPALPGDPVVSITYESLRAAWRRACERAGVADLNIHDLRHTAATRMALQTGNVFLVQALTGHKDINSVQRYVNVSAEDVVRVMHAQSSKALDAGQQKNAAAAFRSKKPRSAQAGPRHEGNVTHVNFRRAA